MHRWLLDYIPVYPARTGLRKGDKEIFAFPHIIAATSTAIIILTRGEGQFLSAEYAAPYDDKMYEDEYNNNIMDLIILYMYKYMRIYLPCELSRKPATKKNKKIQF